MKPANKVGPNVTGMDSAPDRAKAMIEGAETLTHLPETPREYIVDFNKRAIEEAGTVGSVPPPSSLKGAFTTGKEKLKGHSPEVLINKLGQRLAFERAGTRLYDALIKKCEAGMDKETEQVVSIDKLKAIRDEEHEHVLLLVDVIKGIGADPTAMTPDADVTALASMGLPKVLTEPRTTILQCLEAIQIAELADNVAWENLQELCLAMGLNDISARFSKPVAQERVHEETISQWVNSLVTLKAGV